MDCKDISPMISRALDGELPPPEQEALRKHLSECSSCAAIDQAERAVRTAMVAPRPALSRAEVDMAVDQLHWRIKHEKSLRWTSFYRVAAAVLLAWLVSSIASYYMTTSSLRARIDSLTGDLASARASEDARARSLVSAALVTPTEATVTEQIQAFGATYEYLNGSLRWMVSDGEDVQLGMDGATTRAATPRRQALVLNFQYVEHAAGREARVLSKPEFVMISGEEVSVRLRGDSAGEPTFRYRVKAERLVDGQIRAEVNFANEDFASAEVNTKLNANVQLVPGKPVLLGASGDSTRRWELYLWGAARPAVGGKATQDGKQS